MSRAVQCPSCGAQHNVTNPGITALSCDYCKTLVYWDEQAVHDSGVKAVLDAPSSALRVGEVATLQGKDLIVLGRIRYSYGGGVWDEWFLEGDDQEITWLTEDEKEFSLERQVETDPSVPPFAELRVGAPITVHKRSFMIEEMGRATCQGVEGQVPFVVIPNETYPFADLASEDGSLSIGLEYDEDGSPSVYQGAFIDRDALKVDGGSPFPELLAPGVSIPCGSCGAPLEGGYPPDTEMAVCPQCGSGLELSATQSKVVTKNRERAKFPLEIGDKGTFDQAKYEVVGRLRYVESDWGMEYVSNEFLLWNQKRGYLWLEESDGHWVRNKRSHRQPSTDVFSIHLPKTRVQVGKQTYQFVEQGETELRYVDGALPWLAKVGERFRYADMVAPPKSFGAEESISGSSHEIEFFEGDYLTTQQMGEAFGREFTRPLGVGPSQPFIRTGGQKFLMWVGLLFVFINFSLFGYACTKSGRVVLRTQVSAQQYRNQHMSEPFKIRYKPAVVRIRGSAPVSNSWVSLQMALVNAKDEVCLESEGDVGYYHGYEGGESWSEGSRSFSQLIRVDEPGTYRLLVFGAAGTGETANSSGGESVSIEVREGVMPSTYFLLMLIISLLYPLKEIVRKYSFEKRRFPSSDDDDDD